MVCTSSGTVSALYEYDAYGKLLGVTTSSGSQFTAKYAPAVLNPLRYRGYVYDTETGFYYLQSRYYDPRTCRFMNADTHVFSGTNLKKHNMYAYCTNNPILKADPYGTDAIVLYDKNFPTHLGAVVQDEDGVWYHFYWGAPGGVLIFASCTFGSQDVGKTKYEGTDLNVFSKTILDDINASGVYSYGEKILDYEGYAYLFGDYSSCIDDLGNPVEPYGVIENNCSQFTLRTLSEVENNYSSVLKTASQKVLPSKAFDYVKNNAVSYDINMYHKLTLMEKRLS